jgi:hypothetical protein
MNAWHLYYILYMCCNCKKQKHYTMQSRIPCVCMKSLFKFINLRLIDFLDNLVYEKMPSYTFKRMEIFYYTCQHPIRSCSQQIQSYFESCTHWTQQPCIQPNLNFTFISSAIFSCQGMFHIR